MTVAMPFLQKAILLSYAPRPFAGGYLLVLVVCQVILQPKSVGVGNGYMPQRLVCFVVRMVKNNDQAQKSIRSKPKQITLERTWQYGIHSQTGREQLPDRGLPRV